MTNAELTELNSKRRIHQIGFIVKDIEKAMQKWLDVLNVGPWTVIELNDKNCRNCIENGEPSTAPFKFVVAVAMFGEVQIELMQPFYGVKIYQDFLDKHGEGLQHFKEFIPEDKMEETVKGYADKGLGVIRQGYFLEDIHIYLDTLKDFGFHLELGNCPDLEMSDDMFYIYPREG